MAAQGQRWLLFADDGDLRRALTGHLVSQDCDVIYVVPGERFEQVGETSYAVNPGRLADYEALCQELRVLGKLPERVVHLWATTDGAVGFDACQDLGFCSLVHLMQALAAQGNPAPLRLLAGSCQAHAVLGSELVRPAMATLLGLCKVIPQEYPGVICCSADLESPLPAGAEAAALAEALVAELTAGCPDAVVAYRNGYRWAQCFEPLRPGPRHESPLRGGGVYLITGGLGRLGLLLASDLARRSRATVILTTRSAFPDRATWPARLAAGDSTDPTVERISQLQAVEALGGRVVVATADVADAARMQELVDGITAGFGALHGVIHLAGLINDSTMAEVRLLRPELCAAHFRPKAKGLLVLEQALGGRSLDFCVLFSSLSTALGGVNGGLCRSQCLHGCLCRGATRGAFPWISVAWDGWQPEGEPGEGSYILPDEGLEVLQRILSLRRVTRRVLVSTRDLEARLDRWLRLKTPPAGEAGHRPRHSRSTTGLTWPILT